MNRHIEFRVWDNRNRNWVSIFEKQFLNNPEYTVQQFTGLTDKNGGKIFEGDTVKCRALSTIETVTVEDIRRIPVQISAWPTAYGKGNGECEVIGNIFETK